MGEMGVKNALLGGGRAVVRSRPRWGRLERNVQELSDESSVSQSVFRFGDWDLSLPAE